jgi:heavy metal translocating P-type ATPase
MMLEFFKDQQKRGLLFVILSFLALLASFIFASQLPIDPAWVAIGLCGVPIIINAGIALATEFDIKADLLVSLALIAAVIIGEYFAAGEVALIMTIGAMLEDRTVAKARAGIEKLNKLTPRTARVLLGDEETIIPAEQVAVGDTLRVLAGETVAVDGIITSGQTSINQSVMTGESLPVDKSQGDEVFSGTVNQFGIFEMRAEKVGENSSLQRMIKLVESADAGKAKIVGIADRWATWIVVIALVAAAATWFFSGEIIRAVTILVVFCPCALVLATPTAIMAGIGNASKYGILIRAGDALERLAKVDSVVFDKTGTLTHGTPEVIAVESFAGNVTKEQLLTLTASAERLSEHPLGKAITAYYQSQNQQLPPEPTEFKLVAGRGVEAVIDGIRVVAGNQEMFTDYQIELGDLIVEQAKLHKNKGRTVIYVAYDRQAQGFIALADQPRSESKNTIAKLINSGVTALLLTGDNEQAAKHTASSVGIANVIADCLPETKLQTIQNYQQDGQNICMIGDGVNDAPALKSAYVGIAMGGIGSDIAIDAADIVLVADEIKVLPHLFALAHKTMQTIHLNLSLSMLLNFIAIVLAISGILNPVVGALVHNVGSVVVIINSSLLLKWRQRQNQQSQSKRSYTTKIKDTVVYQKS